VIGREGGWEGQAWESEIRRLHSPSGSASNAFDGETENEKLDDTKALLLEDIE